MCIKIKTCKFEYISKYQDVEYYIIKIVCFLNILMYKTYLYFKINQYKIQIKYYITKIFLKFYESWWWLWVPTEGVGVGWW